MSTVIEEGITGCWQNSGFHVYGAGPCFDTREQALAYKSMLDKAGIKWYPSDEPRNIVAMKMYAEGR